MGGRKNRPLRRAQRPVSGVVDRRGGIFTRRKGRRGKGGFKDTHETVREPEHGFVLAERDEGANTRNRGQFLLPEMWVEYALPGGCVQRRFGERQCVLQVPSSPTPSQCALICRPEPGTNGGCPKRAECQPIQGLGICTYPTSSSSEIEDGK